MKSQIINRMPLNMLKSMSRSQYVILDVRTCHEFSGGHIEGAVNIPYDQLDFFLNEIKAWKKPIVIVSVGGRRSHIATEFLFTRGLEVVDGGDWEEIKGLIENQ